MLFDTHTHLNFEAFEIDWKEAAERALSSSIKIINVGSNLKTSRKAIQIAEEFGEGVYAAVGLHPTHVLDEEVDINEYEKMAEHPKVVAIGEIGLDYFRLPTSIKPEGVEAPGGRQIRTPLDIKNLQAEVFSKFLELSKKTKLPVIVHCREAHQDLINFLEQFDKAPGFDARGVMHCFSGSWEEAKRYLNLNFLISFTGVITFAHCKSEALKKVPLNRIMVETDCPYLTPEPHRGERNEPSYVEYVAREMARAKGVTFEEVAKQTTGNALSLFKKIKIEYRG